MPQWEYAQITYSGSLGEYVYVRTFKDGQVIERKDFRSSHKVLEALTLLGDEGWELVLSQSVPPHTVLYLKRPKTQE